MAKYSAQGRTRSVCKSYSCPQGLSHHGHYLAGCSSVSLGNKSSHHRYLQYRQGNKSCVRQRIQFGMLGWCNVRCCHEIFVRRPLGQTEEDEASSAVSSVQN